MWQLVRQTEREAGLPRQRKMEYKNKHTNQATYGYELKENMNSYRYSIKDYIACFLCTILVDTKFKLPMTFHSLGYRDKLRVSVNFYLLFIKYTLQHRLIEIILLLHQCALNITFYKPNDLSDGIKTLIPVSKPFFFLIYLFK